jgi:hypothetical protein
MTDSHLLGTRIVGPAALLALAAVSEAAAEIFVDLGANGSRIEADIATVPGRITTDVSGLHVGAGLRRELSRGSIGVRIEIDDLDGDSLLAVRALDYRRHVSQRFAVTAFAGAARLDLATPAYGYYLGIGGQLKELWPSWSLSFDLKYGDKIARDNLLPSDPPTIEGRDDSFYDVSSFSLYLSRRF